jgi:hypothetical protein
MVNKVIEYHDKSYGSWRNNIVMISDSDETLMQVYKIDKKLS